MAPGTVGRSCPLALVVPGRHRWRGALAVPHGPFRASGGEISVYGFKIFMAYSTAVLAFYTPDPAGQPSSLRTIQWTSHVTVDTVDDTVQWSGRRTIQWIQWTIQYSGVDVARYSGVDVADPLAAPYVTHRSTAASSSLRSSARYAQIKCATLQTRTLQTRINLFAVVSSHLGTRKVPLRHPLISATGRRP